MNAYFRLQFIRMNRILREIGINPLIGFLSGILIFILLSELLFYKTDFAKYIILLTALSIPVSLGEKQRSEFILLIYGQTKFRKIRIVENLISVIPFLIVLILKTAYTEAAFLLIFSILFAFWKKSYQLKFTIPTPFYRSPFEYTVGFRKTILIFPIAYALTIIALVVDNMNLGIFSMMTIFIVALTFSAAPEHEYYVWVHARYPNSFLRYKCFHAIKNASLLAVPILLALSCFYPLQIFIFVLLFLIGNLYVLTIVVMKYASYPNELNLPEGIVLTFSIFFPPMMLFILPFYISKAYRKLSPLLNDQH